MRAWTLRGKKFGRLTVVSRLVSKPGRALWYCVCECGGSKRVVSAHLNNGTVRSCGCLVKKHGHASNGKHSRTYQVWDSMVRRCASPTHPAYAAYGGRGITVCAEWVDFKNFLRDMGEQPRDMTLDRRDNDQGYSRDNCRWATWVEQNRNKRGVRIVTADGVSKTIVEWSEQFGWPHHVICSRLRDGWSEERAVNTPWRPRGT